ncbi:hypothetical protein KXW59_005656, partial [Aspergillus fumigatus]
DSSFLLSPPIKYKAREPSLRQLFAGFVPMALSEPKYFESPSFQPRDLRGPPPLRVSAPLLRNPDYPAPALTSELDSVTSNSVIVIKRKSQVQSDLARHNEWNAGDFEVLAAQIRGVV